MATIERRENGKNQVSYRAKVRIYGHPMQSATFTKRSDAVKWARETEIAIQQGRYHQPTREAKKRTMAELLDRYQREVVDKRTENVRTLTQEVRWWREQLGTCLIADVTPSMLVECRTVLESGISYRGRPRTPATINRYFSLLSHVFRIAIDEWEWAEDNPVKKIKKQKESREAVKD